MTCVRILNFAIMMMDFFYPIFFYQFRLKKKIAKFFTISYLLFPLNLRELLHLQAFFTIIAVNDGQFDMAQNKKD